MVGDRLDPMNLPEAKEWRDRFGGTPGLFDFISQRVSLTVALAVGKVLWTGYVEVRSCVLIQERFDDESFEQWWDHFGGNVRAIEQVINHVHLWDLFPADAGNVELEVAMRKMAELIAAGWRCSLATEFPDRRFDVITSDGSEDYGPTVTFRSA